MSDGTARGFLSQLWHGGPFGSPLAVAVTVVMSVTIILGVPWLLSLGDESRAPETLSSEDRLMAMQFIVDVAGGGPLVSDYSVSGDTLTLTMSNGWHLQPYRERLDGARAFQSSWASACEPLSSDLARLVLVDSHGAVVGGSKDDAPASSIWVKE